MNFIHVIKKIHLWLGITTGPLVFVIAITGSIYTFQDEIQNATQPYRFYDKKGTDLLPPVALKKLATEKNPNKKVHAVQIFMDNHAAKVIFYAYQQYYEVVYLNPESGEILAVDNLESGFFHFILEGHFYLWLPPTLGQPLVASVTLVFAFIIISGLFIWWPRTGNKSKRFKIKWNASWKRRNFDLHSVFGFYSFIFALIFAITGLVWGFEWFRNMYFSVNSFGNEYVNYYEPESLKESDSLEKQINIVFFKLQSENPNCNSVEVHFPETKLGSVAANVNTEYGTYWKTNYYYFDQSTGKEIPVKHHWNKLENATFSEKLMRMNYDIHTGAVLGLPGKILAFFVSLVIASLPITGLLFYIGKRRKVSYKS